MKGVLDRTKVVLRHLPPSITETMFIEQVDSAFADRYNWFSFRPGKSSQKRQSYSRVYIDFKNPEDVLEFAEFFNGHVFVNEKAESLRVVWRCPSIFIAKIGTYFSSESGSRAQFKTIAEYAPSQHVPKHWSKKDGREGTIFKDPEYLEFLEFLAKPIENLPSAEIQLERREAERAGAPNDSFIVTPLMDFVRQKRAAKCRSRRSLPIVKPSRRTGGSSGGSPSSASAKRGFEKRRGSTKMSILRDSLKNASGKDKSTYILVSKRDEQQLSDKAVTLASSVGTEISEGKSGISGISDAGKAKFLLLKGKEKEISHVAGSMLSQQNITSPIKNMLGSAPTKQNSRREGRMIRSMLLSKDYRQSLYSAVQSEKHIQTSNLEKERRPPLNSHAQLVLKDTNSASDDKVAGNDLHGSEKPARRSRHKDRPDHSVRTLCRSNGSYASDESLSPSASQSAQIPIYPSEGSRKHISHRVAVANGSSAVIDGKPGKRTNVSGYGSHEKQVWVQKSSSGS